jgi:chromosome segregation ATPase
MRIRHRVPTVFTLSMLDVFCCALGCVIFLWLYNEKLAKERFIKAGQTEQQLSQTQNDLVSAQNLIEALKKEIADARQLLADRLAQLEQTQSKLTATEATAGSLRKDLAEFRQLAAARATQLENAKKDLSDSRTRVDALSKDLAASKLAVATLTTERDQTRKDLSQAQELMSKATDALRALQAKADATAETLAKTTKEREKLSTDMAKLAADQKKEEDKLTAELANLQARKKKEEERAAALADVLAKKTKELEQLSANLAALQGQMKSNETSLSSASKHVLELETLVRQKDEKLTSSMTRIKTLEDQLHDADAQIKNLRTAADTLTTTKTDLEQQNKKWLVADMRVKELERELVNRKERMLDVQGEIEALKIQKREVDDQVARMRLAADNRFAGIQLTGRRVIFLIDISGSMLYVDEKTKAPEKWTEVIATTVKLLKSLPDIEKFQVILFSESARFLFSDRLEWIDIDSSTAERTIDKVRRALEATEVDGNTNMYAGFEKAFEFRSKGLDTIYLLSDGLPNMGPLALQDQDRPLSTTEREEKLSKYVRSMLKQRWNREPKVKINSVGFFYESPDVGAFLWALSRENDGSFVGMSKP